MERHEHHAPQDEQAHDQHPPAHGHEHAAADVPTSAAPKQHDAMDHRVHRMETDHSDHAAGHAAHVDHTGHEEMFRQRFWICLVLSIPVVLYSAMIQEWLG